MHDRRGKNHQGYLWQYGTPGGATIFDFQMSRGREGPAHFLNKFEGILQTDGYVSYVRGAVSYTHLDVYKRQERLT